jgi:glycosyltransferase involved in cell wall biosynthesis
MNILFLNHNVAWNGGTFYRAYHVARYLVRRGHSVTLLTISPTSRAGLKSEISEGVEIIQTPDLLWGKGRTGWDLWNTLNRIVYLRRRPKWDIVHAWDSRPAVIWPALYVKRQNRKTGGKLIIDWCDWWGRGGTQAERPGWFAKLLYGPIETYFEEAYRTRAHGTTVASRALRQRALELGVPSASMILLPGGSDTETIKPGDRRAARKELNLPGNCWLVGYMGAITTKEAVLLAETLALARSEIPNLHFMAIGVSIAGSNLPFRRIMGEEQNWIWETGRVAFSRVSVHLAACDALILPMRSNISNVARWPSKINDYLSSGRPIVSTRLGEVKPMFEKEIGVATDDNSQALADGLVKLARDPKKMEYYGRQARAMAETDLNWDRLVEQLEAFYLRVRDDHK